MPGHAGGGQGLLPDQQELCERPAGAGSPLLRGQDDGGERSALMLLCHIHSKKVFITFHYVRIVAVLFDSL